MARIRSYARDTNITNQDRILGSSYEGILNNQPIYKTKNYKLTDLAAYFSQNFDVEGVNYDLAAINAYWTNLANSLGNVNEEGSLANISINFANDLVAVISTVPDTFTELALSNLSAIPQAFADFLFTIADINEEFANQVLGLATSTAYATEASFNSLSAFVDEIDTNVQGLQVDVTDVVAATDTNTGAITANATAITALGVRTTTAEANVTALQADFTSLETVVNTNTGNISTNATQLSSLGTVVDTATTDIATLKIDVTVLESSIDTLSGEVTANASDISLLTTNVDTIAGEVTAVQTDVTALTTTVNDNTGDIATQATQVSLLANRVDTAESNILNTQTDVTSLTTTVNGNTGNIATNASNISILQTNVSTAQTDITGIITDIQQIETSVDNVTGDVEANAIAITGLGTRVTTAESNITNVQGNITTLQTNLNTQTGRIDTNVNNISTLSTTVTNNFTTLQGSITTVDNARISGDAVNASSISAVEAVITDANTGLVATRALAQQGFDAAAEANGFAESRYFVSAQANGVITGMEIKSASSSGAGTPISQVIFNTSDFVIQNGSGVTQLNIDGSGNAVFSGDISGASGTFTGGVSGTGYSLNNSGLSLTNSGSSISIGGGVTINSSGISGIGFSLTSSGLSLSSGPTATAISTAQSTADGAKGVTDNLSSVVTITNTKLYQGTGVFNTSTTGFYLDNAGQFSLKDKLSFDGSTLTVNGSGTFTGTLDAGLVNISGNIIRVGVASNYGTFGKLNFVHPDNITSVGTVEGYYYTSGGSPAGGGIFMEAASGASIRLGTNLSGSQTWEIESSSSSIGGTPSEILFYNSNGNYRFSSTVTGTGTTAIFDISGNLKRASSSRRYKNNILDYDKGLDVIKQIRPVYYNYINEYNIQNAGFIAEEIEELGLKEFVRYDKQLRPDAVDYGQMVALLIKGIQEQQQQIDALKAEIELLKAQ